jgi:pimeloyl-ACP methyl ester carboxylesterase
MDSATVKPTVLLIPSTLLGPMTWASTARILADLGRQVRVPSMQGVAGAAVPYWPAGVDAIVESARAEPVILVPHSNSGLYVPAVVNALGEQVRGVVFVDAALPGSGAFALREFLDGLADADGLLPPWTSWWDPSEVAGLFPDGEVREQVEAEQVRMPVDYYDHLPPTVDGWDRQPCGYIWFAEPYNERADEAVAKGWPTRRVAGRHLHMLVDPEAVAAAVLEIAGRWR